METKTVVRTAPQTIGMSSNISSAMAPPRISASDVEMEASTAVPNMGRDTHLGVYCVAASERAKPCHDSQVSNIVLQYDQHDGGQRNHP